MGAAAAAAAAAAGVPCCRSPARQGSPVLGQAAADPSISGRPASSHSNHPQAAQPQRHHHHCVHHPQHAAAAAAAGAPAHPVPLRQK